MLSLIVVMRNALCCSALIDENYERNADDMELFSMSWGEGNSNMRTHDQVLRQIPSVKISVDISTYFLRSNGTTAIFTAIFGIPTAIWPRP